jgi:hypothetical protein
MGKEGTTFPLGEHFSKPGLFLFLPLFTVVRGRLILRCSPPEVATWHTKIRHLADAPSTSCLLTWWR